MINRISKSSSRQTGKQIAFQKACLHAVLLRCLDGAGKKKRPDKTPPEAKQQMVGVRIQGASWVLGPAVREESKEQVCACAAAATAHKQL